MDTLRLKLEDEDASGRSLTERFPEVNDDPLNEFIFPERGYRLMSLHCSVQRADHRFDRRQFDVCISIAGTKESFPRRRLNLDVGNHLCLGTPPQRMFSIRTVAIKFWRVLPPLPA